ncbi:hypothetical protein M422DRAFT_45386 [Sphaerobolus stellatus SS14]|nr:hypothetical protein M422DRAFT_45386 [Sphaerobolus stellatus SS14]
MLDSRRDLHERHAETYGLCERLEKAYKELSESANASPPRWLSYEPRILSASPEASSSAHSPESSRSSEPPADAELLANAFGVISLRDARKTQYHGRNAIAEIKEEDHEDAPPESLPIHPSTPADFPSDLFFLQLMFPYPGPPNADKEPSMDSFITAMPSRERATELMKNYYTYFTWIASPVSLKDLREIFRRIYPTEGPFRRLRIADAHRLSILLSIFLLGSLCDFKISAERRATDCELYLMLAKAALVCDPIFDHMTLQAVQAVVSCHFKYYDIMVPPAITCSTKSDAAMGSVRIPDKNGTRAPFNESCTTDKDRGIDRNGRDPTLFIQNDEQIQRAEQTFWEYLAQDIWTSYMFGRPPSMANEVIQCRWPSQVEVHPGHAPDYFTWKFSFSKLLSEVMDATSLDDLHYSEILKADRKLRRHGVPDNLEWPGPDEPFPKDEAIGRTFQRWVVASLENIAIMYLHRPFAWRALSEPGELSQRHPYWRSVVALFHSASSIAACGRKVWLAHPQVTARLAPFWSHTLSASQCLGALACLKPGCLFARGALMYFDEAVDMFVTAGNDIRHLSKQRDQMRSIQRRAHDAFFEHRNKGTTPFGRKPGPPTSEISSEALSEFAMSFNHPAIPQKGQDRQSRINESQMTLGTQLAPDMPPEYEVYRHQEDGWEHLISFN